MTRRTVLLSALGFPLALPGKGKEKQNDVSIQVDVVFGGDEKRIIREWVRSQPSAGLPPGLAKRDRLPPGLEKQLRRKGSLPPGLEKRFSSFPPELDARLGPIGPDYDRVFVSGRAAIVARIGSVVVDIFIP